MIQTGKEFVQLETVSATLYHLGVSFLEISYFRFQTPHSLKRNFKSLQKFGVKKLTKISKFQNFIFAKH